MARVSVLSIEYSMCRPDERVGDAVFSTTFGRPVSQVPVLHIFGRAAGGPHHQTVCVHVHNVMPYFYVPRYDADVTALQFGMQLESVAIHCLRLPTTSRLLHHVALVSAVPFYGYHARPKAFFKVFVYQPAMVSKLANLLGSSSHVGGRQWQPYEAHVPYHFQFMVDYGLTGTGMVDLLGATLRRPLPQPLPDRANLDPNAVSGVYHHQSMPQPFASGITSASPRRFESGAPLPDGCTLASEAWDLEKISTAAVEMDTTPDLLPPCTTPGSSLNGVKRGLREYLVEHGLGMRVLVDAVAPFTGRVGSVRMTQSLDPMVPWMRNLATRYMTKRGDAAHQTTPTPLSGQRSRSLSSCCALPPSTTPLHALLAPRDHDTTRHSGARPPSMPAPTDEIMEDDDANDFWRPSATFQMLDLIAAADDVAFDDEEPLDTTAMAVGDDAPAAPPQRHDAAALTALPLCSTRDGNDSAGVLYDAAADEEVDLFAEDNNCQLTALRTPAAAASPISVDEGDDQGEYVFFSVPRNIVGGGGTTRDGAQPSQLDDDQQDAFGRCRRWRQEPIDSLHSSTPAPGTNEEDATTAAPLSHPMTLVQWFITAADTPWRHETRHLERCGRLHRNDLFLTEVCDTMRIDVIARYGRCIRVVASLAEWHHEQQKVADLHKAPSDGGVWLCRHRFQVATQTLHPLMHPTDDPWSVLLVIPEMLRAVASRHAPVATSSDDEAQPIPVSTAATTATRRRSAGSAAAVVAATQLARGQTRVVTIEDVHQVGRELATPMRGGMHNGGDVDTGVGATMWSVDKVAWCATQRGLTVHGSDAAASTCDPPCAWALSLAPPSVTSGTPVATEVVSDAQSSSPSTSTACADRPSPKRQRAELPSLTHCSMPATGSASVTSPPPRPRAATACTVGVDETTSGAAVPAQYAVMAAVSTDTQAGTTTVQRFALQPLMGATAALEGSGATHHAFAPLLTTITQRHGSARNDRQRGMARRRPVRKPQKVRRSHDARPTSGPSAATAGSSGGTTRMPYLSQACIEVITDAGANKCSDAAHNTVLAAAIACTSTHQEHATVHYFVVSDAPPRLVCSLLDTSLDFVECFATEGALLSRVQAFLMQHDPDILTSWDSIRGGIGYLAERARVVLRWDLLGSLGRLLAPPPTSGTFGWRGQHNAGQARTMQAIKEEDDVPPSQEDDPESREPGNFAPRSTAVQPMPRRNVTLKVQGRIVLHLAKVCRSELKQTSYTLQGCYQTLFGVPLPQYTDAFLADAFHRGLGRRAAFLGEGAQRSGSLSVGRFLLHVLRDKVLAPLRVARHLDLVVRTSELAQLYGILFMEVLSRGSQYRVESFMLRFSKPRGYVAVSPSREQVMLQNRQEGIALVMEPYSGFYTDPVVVLDFRSLYPSMVIAYNLCYSTCLGKVSKDREVKLGAMACYQTPRRIVHELLQQGPHDDDGGDAQPKAVDTPAIIFAPTSCMFVSEDHRRGILPEMLDQILSTRFQVQAVMKLAAAEGDHVTRRVLDAQQLGLKLLANVTYGYAAATFSGRMPCSDIADSIVLLGRQTLERAIRQIEGHPQWRAKVIYGDTDSLFIHLPGRSKADAFQIAEAMAAAVTAANPDPVTLKFEKVYQPCLMITKKRYVGYAWEKRSQTVPNFDAKGIETIRRDQCAATSRIQESLLRCLFDTRGDLESLRRTFEAHVMKFVWHDINPTDVILRREVKLGTYAKESTLPPAARVALQKIQRDSASAPLYGERVPYVVVTGASDKLMDLVEDPLRILQRDVPFAVNVAHYMEKHILPALERVFHLVDVDVRKWYAAMPRQTASKSALFSIQHMRWHVPGLEAKVAGERAASRCIEDLGASIPPLSAATSGSGGNAIRFAPSARCAVCGQRPSNTHSWLPPVCRACLDHGPQRATSLSIIAQRRCSVERELLRLSDRCTQCAWTRIDPATPADLEALLATTSGADASTAAHRQLEAGFAVDRGATCVPALGACVSLDCAQTFQIVRARELLHQLVVLEDFLSRCATVTGLSSGGGVFRSDDGGGGGVPSGVAGLRLGEAVPDRFCTKPIGAKERPLHID